MLVTRNVASYKVLFGAALMSVLSGNFRSSASSESLAQRWTETVCSRGWLTAFVTSAPGRIAVDRIVARVGDEDRIVYQAQARDVELGQPVVSPDGRRLAFSKTEEVDAKKFIFTHKIYGVDADGKNFAPLIDFGTTGIAMRGAITPTPVAWSHDNRKLLFIRTIKNEVKEQPPQSRSEAKRLAQLMLLDVSSRQIEELLTLSTRVTITPQSWAPDRKRFVYKTDISSARIFNVTTGSEIDLGPGLNPTWSPDGRFIAVQEPGAKDSHRNGNYVLISTEPPYVRTTLLSNSMSPFFFSGIGYSGAVIWSPDSRFLIAWYYPGEQGYPYVVERATGEITKLPSGSVGESLGGTP